MPIIDLQRRGVQLGRIRLGAKAAGGRPKALQTFRLTSRHRDLLDTAAERYGGTVEPWEEPKSGDRWELFTETDELPIMVPPAVRPGDSALSQWYELWGGGGCVRRCDGYRAVLVDGKRGDLDCVCDPDDRACEPHTRLQVVLVDLDAFGLWRLDTKGANAAAELASIADDLARATAAGWKLPATLRLEQREWRGVVEGKGAVTHRFVVPVIIPRLPHDQAVGISQGAQYVPPGVGTATTPTAALPPAPPVTPLQPPPGLHAVPDDRQGPAERHPSRRRGRPTEDAIPPTQLRPPTAAQSHAAEQTEASRSSARDIARDLILRLPEAMRGADMQGVRHDLYTLAAGTWDASATALDGRARNLVVKWSGQYMAGVVSIERSGEGERPPWVRLLGPDGEHLITVLAEVTSDLPSDQEPTP